MNRCTSIPPAFRTGLASRASCFLGLGLAREQFVDGVGHGLGGRGARLRNAQHFMGELTAQVRISEFSNCTTWYENERVCGQVSHETCNSFSYQVLQLDIPT